MMKWMSMSGALLAVAFASYSSSDSVQDEPTSLQVEDRANRLAQPRSATFSALEIKDNHIKPTNPTQKRDDENWQNLELRKDQMHTDVTASDVDDRHSTFVVSEDKQQLPQWNEFLRVEFSGPFKQREFLELLVNVFRKSVEEAKHTWSTLKTRSVVVEFQTVVEPDVDNIFNQLIDKLRSLPQGPKARFSYQAVDSAVWLVQRLQGAPFRTTEKEKPNGSLMAFGKNFLHNGMISDARETIGALTFHKEGIYPIVALLSCDPDLVGKIPLINTQVTQYIARALGQDVGLQEAVKPKIDQVVGDMKTKTQTVVNSIADNFGHSGVSGNMMKRVDFTARMAAGTASKMVPQSSVATAVEVVAQLFSASIFYTERKSLLRLLDQVLPWKRTTDFVVDFVVNSFKAVNDERTMGFAKICNAVNGLPELPEL